MFGSSFSTSIVLCDYRALQRNASERSSGTLPERVQIQGTRFDNLVARTGMQPRQHCEQRAEIASAALRSMVDCLCSLQAELTP